MSNKKTTKKPAAPKKPAATKKPAAAKKTTTGAMKLLKAKALEEKHKTSLARNAKEISQAIEGADESLLVGKTTKTGGQALTTIPMSIWKKENKNSWSQDYPEAKSIREAYRFYYAGAVKSLGDFVEGHGDLFAKRVGFLRSGAITVSYGRRSEATQLDGTIMS